MRISQQITRTIKADLANYLTYLRNLNRQRNPIESVHQLRVSCRRLYNFFWVYRALFVRKAVERWLAHFEHVIDELSDARDLDVQLQNLKALRRNFQKEGRKTLGIEEVIGRTQKRRKDIELTLAKYLKQRRHEAMAKQIRLSLPKMAAKTRKLSKQEFEALGLKRIRKRAVALYAMRSYARRRSDVSSLHRLRIRAKRLRFTMEALQPVFDKTLNGPLAVVRDVQKHLGIMHDYDVWMAELETYRRDDEHFMGMKLLLSAMMKEVRQKRDASYLKFFAVWQKSVENGLWVRLQDGVLNRKV